MASARDLKKKIRSISNTAKITRTMEMVATAKSKRAQTRVEATKPYSSKLVEILENLITANEFLSYPVAQQYGIWVYHGYATDDPQTWGRNNVVRGNVVRGADTAIALNGSGIGSNNRVAFNQIYGGYEGSPGRPSPFLVTPPQRPPFWEQSFTVPDHRCQK